MIGHPCNDMTYPDLLFAVLASFSAESLFYSPEDDASTYTSNDLSSFGLRMIPRSLVPFRYFTMFLTASPWDSLGFDEKRAHWCTAYAISGINPFSR